MRGSLFVPTKKGLNNENNISQNKVQASPILPDYPKVLVTGSEVKIMWNPGELEYWGEEEDIAQAKKIAIDMELELKATAFVKKMLMEALSNIYDDFIRIGIPYKIAKNALHNGHINVLHTILQFEKTPINNTQNLDEFIENL